MASAIEASQLPGLARQLEKENRRRMRRSKGRKTISKTARIRNQGATHRWWQPSRALWKLAQPRCSERTAAIREEIEPPVAYDAAEWFAADDSFDLVAYQAQEERRELGRAAKNYRRRIKRADLRELAAA